MNNENKYNYDPNTGEKLNNYNFDSNTGQKLNNNVSNQKVKIPKRIWVYFILEISALFLAYITFFASVIAFANDLSMTTSITPLTLFGSSLKTVKTLWIMIIFLYISLIFMLLCFVASVIFMIKNKTFRWSLLFINFPVIYVILSYIIDLIRY